MTLPALYINVLMIIKNLNDLYLLVLSCVVLTLVRFQVYHIYHLRIKNVFHLNADAFVQCLKPYVRILFSVKCQSQKGANSQSATTSLDSLWDQIVIAFSNPEIQMLL